MFKFARALTIALTVLGLAFGTVQISATPDITYADSHGQRGDWDLG